MYKEYMVRKRRVRKNKPITVGDLPLAQNGHLNRLASACFFFVCTGAFFARLPMLTTLLYYA